MAIRKLSWIALASWLLAGPALAQEDALEIVQRAFEAATANEEIARQYVFHERVEEVRLDKKGREKRRRSRTWDVSLFEDGELRRLIRRDDRPLTAREEAKEQRKIDRHIAKVQKETQRQRARRRARREKERAEGLEFLEEITRAFEFRKLREEIVDGTPTFVISATPKEGYRPTSREAKVLTKVSATFWIAQDDYGWAQAEIETLDDISWLVYKLSGGSRVTIKQRKLNAEVWMADRWRVRLKARVALVYRYQAEIVGTYSNFRRFTTETEGTEVRLPD